MDKKWGTHSEVLILARVLLEYHSSFINHYSAVKGFFLLRFWHTFTNIVDAIHFNFFYFTFEKEIQWFQADSVRNQM